MLKNHVQAHVHMKILQMKKYSMDRRNPVRYPGSNSMDQARDILIGAVDRIIQLASSSSQRPAVPTQALQPSLQPASLQPSVRHLQPALQGLTSQNQSGKKDGCALPIVCS